MHFLLHVFHLLSYFLTNSKGTSAGDSGNRVNEFYNIWAKIFGGLELDAEGASTGRTTYSALGVLGGSVLLFLRGSRTGSTSEDVYSWACSGYIIINKL